MSFYNDIIEMLGRDKYGYPLYPDTITGAWLFGKITADELADGMLASITEAVASGQVPWDVADFCELHDYVDANEFILETLGLDPSEEGLGLANLVVAIVDVRMRLAPGANVSQLRPSSMDWPLELHEQRRAVRHP